AGRLSGRLAQPMRPRGPVIEAGRSLGLVALDPFPDRLGADTEGSCHGAARLPLLQHAPDKLGPTQRRQAGILMHVHSAPRRSLKCQQLQLPRSGPDGQPIERSHLALAATADRAAAQTEWNMQSTYASSLTQLGSMGLVIAERVKAVSGGELVINFQEPGAIVPALEAFDAV